MSKNKLDLTKLIKEDENAVSNREGFTPLFALADMISSNVAEVSEADIVKEIVKLKLKFFAAGEVNTLISFIINTGIYSTNIINFLIKYLEQSKRQHSEQEILKRALIIRYIIETDQTKFGIRKLETELNIRQKYPWLWIDCIMHYDQQRAIDLVTELLDSGTKLENLLIRIPHLTKKLDDALLVDAFRAWREVLTPQYKQDLMEFISKLNIKIDGLSPDAVALLRNVKYFQEELIS